ncbi:MAG: hypothetical protein QF790_08085 [Gammaproteobacteria bacterium]|jgi:divalent metal cation (Fe/Co/Zn/Cd) transporter|nr:hypothetical protein [Gammaproteobacteria bacterium]MDP6617105.1 hypothetical protein [Gammaproteobacteria bacterium]MDP6695785.1 hypothetical protein [Gammaproteobacteria bacterium]
MILAAKIVSIILLIASIMIVLTAVATLLGFMGEPGAGGVVLVDSIFGVFILFTASRLLWLYAKKKVATESGEQAS